MYVLIVAIAVVAIVRSMLSYWFRRLVYVNGGAVDVVAIRREDSSFWTVVGKVLESLAKVIAAARRPANKDGSNPEMPQILETVTLTEKPFGSAAEEVDEQ